VADDAGLAVVFLLHFLVLLGEELIDVLFVFEYFQLLLLLLPQQLLPLLIFLLVLRLFHGLLFLPLQ
jgi:hypothetical protein